MSEPLAPPSEPAAIPAPLACTQCGSTRLPDAQYCGDCGLIFSQENAAVEQLPTGTIGGRYRIVGRINERFGVSRFRGEDIGGAPDAPLPVILLRQSFEVTPLPEQSGEFDLGTVDGEPDDLDSGTAHLSTLADSPITWPSVAWEQGVLIRAASLSLPRIIDTFVEDGFVYLVEELPVGTSLWDAWDRHGVTHRERFGWLIQLANALGRLHASGAILESLRPDMIVVSPGGVVVLADLTDLLPNPLPPDVPLKGGFSTAPELLLSPADADERADLYAFGALIYALLMGHELSELDFTLTGVPRAYLDRVPDANPFLVRLLSKTFVREVSRRFPTFDGADTDPTGLTELIEALAACQRNLDRVKLDISTWSTIGIHRHGNEDAVWVGHFNEARLSDTDEMAIVLLADGMGGMDSGEVAAALCLRTMRDELLANPPFPQRQDGGESSRATDAEGQSLAPTLILPDGIVGQIDHSTPHRTADAYAERIGDALRAANKAVYEAAQAGLGGRGMGCTAEVLIIDGPLAVIGHVGDSRVYHMRHGRLSQVTRDHTFVARLVELGQITEAEAEVHPRRAELQQAIGGRTDVFPDAYPLFLEPGDWLIVCSDGLSNQLPLATMEGVLRDSRNAEKAARRLVNLAIFDGATDNVTVAAIRVS